VVKRLKVLKAENQIIKSRLRKRARERERERDTNLPVLDNKFRFP
jgi:hypothetical protein